MKRILVIAACIGVIAASPANAQSKKGYAPSSKGAPAAAPAEAPAQRTSAQFLVQFAAEMGVADEDLARLALTKSANAEVRAYAERVVAATAKINAGLQPLLKARGVTVATDKDGRYKVTHDRLLTVSGAAFDRGYLAAITTKLTADAVFLQRVSLISDDAEVKAWATAALPQVQEDRDTAHQMTLKLLGAAYGK